MEWENVLQVKQTSGTLPPRDLNECESRVHSWSHSGARKHKHARTKKGGGVVGVVYA